MRRLGRGSRGGSRSGGLRRGALRVLAISLLGTLSGCAAGPGAGGPPVPSRDIPAIIDAPPLHRMQWGILAIDMETGDTLFSRNPERHFVPASNQKILVGAASMGALGPDYRFTNEFWLPSPVGADGVARNGLVLRASGDPSWSERYHPDLTAWLDSIAAQVAGAGIRQVERGFTVELPGWSGMSREGTWMTGDIGTAYSALPAPMAIEEGTVRVEVSGGGPNGAPARARVVAPGRESVLDASVVRAPGSADQRLRVSHGEDRITIRGGLAPDRFDTLRYASPTPVEDAAAAWAAALRRAGVAIIGNPVLRWLPDPDSTYLPGPMITPPPTAGASLPCALPVRRCPGAQRVVTFESPPMSDLVKGMLEPSQNWIAEQLVRGVGRERGENARGTEGRQLITDFLQTEAGVDSMALTFRDGSGLSAYDLVTPDAIVDVLLYADRQPWAALFRDGLAAPGEEDSTLENRLEDMEGRLEGKTGTITHVNSLSGFLRRDDGSEIVFSILTNVSGLPSGTVRGAMDEVVMVLAGSR